MNELVLKNLLSYHYLSSLSMGRYASVTELTNFCHQKSNDVNVSFPFRTFSPILQPTAWSPLMIIIMIMTIILLIGFIISHITFFFINFSCLMLRLFFQFVSYMNLWLLIILWSSFLYISKVLFSLQIRHKYHICFMPFIEDSNLMWLCSSEL